MTDRTGAEDERHEQVPQESVPAPQLRLPPVTGEPDQRDNSTPDVTKPPWHTPGRAGLGAAGAPVRSTANGHATAGHAAVAAARPMALLRDRPGTTGQTTRPVHLVPLPPGNPASAAGVALCGALLQPDLVETVAPGQGIPCTLCMINHLTTGPPPTPADTPARVPSGEGISGETDPLVAALHYQAWDWPLTLYGHQVWLTLHPDTVALIIPVLLAAQVTGILHHRHCPPPTLIHPETPEHWVMLAAARCEGTPPWPRWVHRAITTLPLPPTMTPHGPITWVYPPQANALHQCWEFEIFAALRTALRDPPA
jgi:hypothetical protein